MSVKYRIMDDKVWEAMMDAVDAAIDAAADGTIDRQSAMMSVRQVQQNHAAYECGSCGRWLLPVRSGIRFFREEAPELNAQ